MAVHKIKAKDDAPSPKTKGKVAKSKTPEPKKAKTDKPSKTNRKKGFILFRPLKALGRYIRDSWREIRQVRWPNRKLTWKMTLSVIIYVIVFAAVIMLLDALFSFMFNKLLGV